MSLRPILKFASTQFGPLSRLLWMALIKFPPVLRKRYETFLLQILTALETIAKAGRDNWFGVVDRRVSQSFHAAIGANAYAAYPGWENIPKLGWRKWGYYFWTRQFVGNWLVSIATRNRQAVLRCASRSSNYCIQLSIKVKMVSFEQNITQFLALFLSKTFKFSAVHSGRPASTKSYFPCSIDF